MSKSSQVFLSVVIAIILIGGGIWWWNASQMSGTETGTATSPNGGSDTLSAGANSDAYLNSDLTNMDTQINGLASDSANINQSMNDQPIPQGQ